MPSPEGGRRELPRTDVTSTGPLSRLCSEPTALRLDSSGFRLRGDQTTRIETFTDAAFAFSLTLLVISAAPPGSFDELRTALAGIPAFLLSATQLMLFCTPDGFATSSS